MLNADIRNNQFAYHDIGFALGHPQVPTAIYNQTGLQTDKENRWYGSNSNIEAFATYLIEVQLDGKPALRKPFIINR
ncbi:MAG: hypothetical protein H6557_09635 [Lewinellaceae bacterium]|nr:hypothetical protein [Phaeodactylibacter sp.]MCB9036867.1 hypothetical protein [Lewinellaceae bacterium]